MLNDVMSIIALDKNTQKWGEYKLVPITYRLEKTKEFAEELKKYTDATIDFLDERLTSVSAEKILISADVSRKKRKQVLDKLSATIILQDYLDANYRKI